MESLDNWFPSLVDFNCNYNYVADTEVQKNIRWHRKPKSELLGIIYLIRVTCYITVEAHRRHSRLSRLNCGYTPWAPISCPVIENFIWIELLLRGHLSYKATFSLLKGDLLLQVWLYILFCVWDKKFMVVLQQCGGIKPVNEIPCLCNRWSLLL
jgi:hypothetical protein